MYQTEQITAIAQAFVQNNLERDAFFRSITALIAGEIDCSRASIWVYDTVKKDAIYCECLYDGVAKRHEQGARLFCNDLRPYFQAMRTSSLIVASKARQHPATSCFNDLYFDPLGIESLLDVEIMLDGEPYGLFCCEQTGGCKEWSDQDVQFLLRIGVLIGISLRKARVGTVAAC